MNHRSTLAFALTKVAALIVAASFVLTAGSARRRRDELESICGVVSNGRMPPASYKVLHPESRLEAHDKKVICAWAARESEREK